MENHRWSGWPGAYCLDCGTEDPIEEALATGNYIEVEDKTTPMGFHYEFPDVVLTECPYPNEGHYDPGSVISQFSDVLKFRNRR